MKIKTKSHEIFEKNCGDDNNFIVALSLSISILSFSLFSEMIKGTINIKSFDFFIIKIICWFVFSVIISIYYDRIKNSVVR